jgi:hypothetical protein
MTNFLRWTSRSRRWLAQGSAADGASRYSPPRSPRTACSIEQLGGRNPCGSTQAFSCSQHLRPRWAGVRGVTSNRRQSTRRRLRRTSAAAIGRASSHARSFQHWGWSHNDSLYQPPITQLMFAYPHFLSPLPPSTMISRTLLPLLLVLGARALTGDTRCSPNGVSP